MNESVQDGRSTSSRALGSGADDRQPPDAGGMARASGGLLCTILMAAAVVAAGTLWADPARLVLLGVPLSLLLAAYGAGRLMLTLLDGGSGAGENPLALAVVWAGVGLAGLSLALTLAAFCGWFRPAIIVATLPVAIGAWAVFSSCRCIRITRPVLPALAAGGVLGVAGLVAWLWGTIPPTFFDELAYHLVIPQRALETGTSQAVPWVVFTLMPHASDLLLGWGMALAGGVGARATQAALWGLCLLSAWALADQVSESRRSSWAAAVVTGLFMTSPMFWFLATLSFAELWLSTAVLISGVVLLDPKRFRRPWLPIGLLLGFVGAVKLAGLFWIGALIAAAFVLGWPWKDLLKAGAVAAACLLPWWIRAIVHTGNPFYPMWYRWLGGSGWNDDTQARLMNDLPFGGHLPGAVDVLRLPIDLVLAPERFGSASDAGLVAVGAVCMLAVWPGLARGMDCDGTVTRRADAGAVFVALAGLCWLWTSPTARFFAPAFAVALAALAGACLRLRRPGLLIALLLIGAAASWGTQRFLNQHEAVFSSARVAVGTEEGDSYLARRLDHVGAARFVRETLPSDARVLFIGEIRPYYFAREAVAPSACDIHPLFRWVVESPLPQALASRLAAEGITHVVLNTREFHRLHEKYRLLEFTGAEAPVQDRRLKALPQVLRRLYQDGGIYVFEVPK